MTHARWLAVVVGVGCVWQLDPPLRAVPDGAVVDVAPDRCTVPGASRACYSGPSGTQGVGLCRGGTQTCTAGAWSECAGETAPGDEDCNNLDDDCNGTVDDVAPRPCGGGASSYRLSASPQTWIEACTAANVTVLFPMLDDGVMAASLGFPFEFFGTRQMSAELSTNGVLGLPLAINANGYRNMPLPSPSTAGMLMPFWDDLFTRTGICVVSQGAEGSRQFVAEWSDAYFYSNRVNTSHITFEVVLSERGNTIDFLYQRMEGEGDRGTGSSATIGLQDPTGALYDQLGFNTPNIVHAGSNLRWTPATTSGVGSCRTAMQTCRAGVWSACAANTMPTVEICDGVDNDCDGVVDDGVVRACFMGPAGSAEIGICRQGASLCMPGGTFSACRGEVRPQPTDICSTPFDENCDNTINDGCS